MTIERTMPDKIQARVSDDVSAEITSREHSMRDRSQTVRDMLDRYLETVRRELPPLSVAEWQLIVDATNGAWYTGAGQADWWRLDVSGAIRLNGAAEKWSVDADALLERLAGLSYAQCVAVLDVSERYWSAVGRGEDPTVPGESRT